MLIKNSFANRYNFTPEDVDNMPVKMVRGFLLAEGFRNEKERANKIKEQHKSKNTNRKW